MSKHKIILLVAIIVAVAGALTWLCFNETATMIFRPLQTKTAVIDLRPPANPIAQLPAAEPKTAVEFPPVISLAAVQYNNGYDGLNLLIQKMTSVLNAHETDILVTPEFSFFIISDLHNGEEVTVTRDAQTGLYEVGSVGTPESNNTRQKIMSIASLAQQHGTNIVLGTIPEKATVAGEAEPVYFNTALVINHQGQIIGRHRKYYVSDSPAMQNAELESVGSFSLITHAGREFTVLPVICGELRRESFLTKAASVARGVDVLVLTAREGDVGYEELTADIQSGHFSKTGHDWGNVRRWILDPYLRERSILKENGYLLADDTMVVGLMNLNSSETPVPLPDWQLTSDHIWGRTTDFQNTVATEVTLAKNDMPASNPSYGAGDHFTLSYWLKNQGLEREVDVYLVLDVGGQYWYWPSWRADDPDFQSQILSYGETSASVLDFIWPADVGSGQAKFWLGLIDKQTGQSLGNISEASFSYVGTGGKSLPFWNYQIKQIR